MTTTATVFRPRRRSRLPAVTRIDSPARRPKARGPAAGAARFTLIELLVVVAIIAILAAMLLPVLGRARYAARLTVCIGNIRQTAMGLMLYADDNDNFWPYRDVVDHSDLNSRPTLVRWRTVDERPKLQPYFSFRDLHCPLAPLGFTAPDTSAADYVWSPYQMYGGWRIDHSLEASGMPKVDSAHQYNGETFRVLVADGEVRRINWAGAWQTNGTHPDRPQLRTLMQKDDTRSCFSLWNRKGPAAGFDLRGVVDRNFGFTDGSVFTLRNLVQEDSRLTRLPAVPKNTSSAVYLYLPPD